MSGLLGFQSRFVHCFSAAKKIVVMAARNMLQSGNWLIKVRGAGEEVKVSSPFKVSVLTLEPLILGDAWAFALTCKPLDEAGFGLMPLASKLSGIIDAFAEVADDVAGAPTGKKAEPAAVATMMEKKKMRWQTTKSDRNQNPEPPHFNSRKPVSKNRILILIFQTASDSANSKFKHK